MRLLQIGFPHAHGGEGEEAGTVEEDVKAGDAADGPEGLRDDFEI